MMGTLLFGLNHTMLWNPLGIIGNIPSATSILILQGENDTQTPVQQVFLLQQRLTEVNHPDHTLIAYPNLAMYSILHLSGSLNLDLYNSMFYQICIHGLKLILDLQIMRLTRGRLQLHLLTILLSKIIGAY